MLTKYLHRLDAVLCLEYRETQVCEHSHGHFAHLRFVFDQQGRVRLFVKHGQGAEPLAQDLRRLIDEG